MPSQRDRRGNTGVVEDVRFSRTKSCTIHCRRAKEINKPHPSLNQAGTGVLTSRKSRESRTVQTLPLSTGCVGWGSLESPVPRQGGNAASRAVSPTKV